MKRNWSVISSRNWSANWPAKPKSTAVQERTAGQSGSIVRYVFDPLTFQRLVVDWRDQRPGDKQYHWEQQGVPYRIEVGPRDVAGGAFVLKNRIAGGKEILKVEEITGPQWLRDRLKTAHDALFARALKYREENTRDAATYEEMKQIIAEKGGFVRVYFNPGKEAEAKIKAETKATVRCIPFAQSGSAGKCIISGEETTTQVLFATGLLKMRNLIAP